MICRLKPAIRFGPIVEGASKKNAVLDGVVMGERRVPYFLLDAIRGAHMFKENQKRWDALRCAGDLRQNLPRFCDALVDIAVVEEFPGFFVLLLVKPAWSGSDM
jgi:hypothetical protein